ncbi:MULTISPECIES: cell division protein FtsQ/DivIB [Polyangium]|uniref:Cell division protein FtsQ n=2 Tax=Polyangium TaxID=55 RepID=A0A4U1JI49_9BACT|nr:MULTISPECIES: FtsQ-type POTRA domain-containing protein [Polyangium]MDI1432567.1 FtsQ-type POTRA domain-containing protein [Polyangium sorediatum]TKD12310.1 FtsQ-type POTRA domain-containing protein [Polyangium fumosum]
MSDTLPPNRRLKKPSTPPIVAAPKDPEPQHDSPPPPGATTSTIRPPKPKAKPRLSLPRPKLPRALSLFLGVMVVLSASVAVAWGARRYIMTSPRFAIRTVLVDGNRRLPAEQVAGAGGVTVGHNIFALDLETAGAAITTEPWVERAQVTRTLPSTVRITVVEREAWAVATIGGELYLVTRDGDPFKRVADGDPIDLPVVTGITPEKVAADRPGVVNALRRALDVVEDMDRAGISKRYPIQEVHLERDGTIVMTIGKDAISLYLGQTRFREKIEQAARVLMELAKRKANPSVIFLDNEAHPERVVVRMR